jgi:hypothetical protein
MEAIFEAVCHNIWGSGECDWAFFPSLAKSGGILLIWNKTKFSDSFLGLFEF